MALCLVTGGGGFIGSHLVDGLLAAGQEVRVLDNWSTGSRANLAHVHDQIEIITGDVTDGALVCQAMKGVELVFHQAALASVPRSVADPLAAHHGCATGTLHPEMSSRVINLSRSFNRNGSRKYQARTFRSTISSAMAVNPIAKIAKTARACASARSPSLWPTRPSLRRNHIDPKTALNG